MEYTIKNRFGCAGVTVSIDCDPETAPAVKLGRAVLTAIRSGANLSGADLRGAYLRGASLHGAYLHGASLHGADLRDANLYDANLRGANLHGAYLHGASLHGADLRDANLSGATLYGEKIARIFARVQREDDPYLFAGVELEAGGYAILAGCRWLTDADYRAHVADEYPDTPKAVETLAILDYIAARAAAVGVAA